MGYYTRYDLSQPKNPVSDEVLAMIIASDENMKYCLDSDGSSNGESTKWYEHENDVEAVSAAYPETVFKLRGEGEESGDIWEKFFKGGKKVYEAKLKTELPQPNLDKL